MSTAYTLETGRTSPNSSTRRSKVRRIVIHHWDDPRRKPTFDGTVGWLLRDSTDVSAHYVVEDGRVARLVPESRVAWHAAGGNADSIGVEINPRQHDGDYETAAALIADIRSRHGNLPLVRHRAVEGSYTSCPGTYDLARLDRLASGGPVPSTTTAPAFPLPRRPGRMYYYGPSGGPQTSVSGRGLNTAVPADVQRVNGRWRSHGLARWQQRMAERGYSITVDGRFGEETERIVRYFQALVGLPVDGKIGPSTYAAAWTEAVR
ncbi:peptidoglycan recognition protein family protein [Brachybacterium paraconglomeratum]|uniref:peptidoglycan recognition protein family protein n=1 Tax=Brachybacterium paraconglomeratum TaxID=173362 RepID=UPI0022AFE896|nr:N-acetylmuramoyl-L-alanine amidase [Brachybacterium paraconglomeratum]MCZ4324753.1 N-acetylmuramoyl-L-alanine amidase [Brachybacterium paraconglomeratum]